MMDQSIEILFGLIKFDMNQIQNYREAIFNVSVAIVAASFGISAFVYRKDCALTGSYKSNIIIGTNVLLLLATIVVAYYDYNGLRYSRASLEMRQAALTAHLFEHKPLSEKSLYPDPSDYISKNISKMRSTLEMIPLYLSIMLLGIKAAIECLLLRKTCVDKTMQEKPAAEA